MIQDEKLKKIYSRSNRTWNNLFPYLKAIFNFKIESVNENDDRYIFDQFFMNKYKNYRPFDG